MKKVKTKRKKRWLGHTGAITPAMWEADSSSLGGEPLERRLAAVRRYFAAVDACPDAVLQRCWRETVGSQIAACAHCHLEAPYLGVRVQTELHLGQYEPLTKQIVAQLNRRLAALDSPFHVVGIRWTVSRTLTSSKC